MIDRRTVPGDGLIVMMNGREDKLIDDPADVAAAEAEPLRCRIGQWSVGIVGDDVIVELDCYRTNEDGTYDREPTRVRVGIEAWERKRGGALFGGIVVFAPTDLLPPL